MFRLGKKQDLSDACFGPAPVRAPSVPTLSVQQLEPWRHAFNTGTKFPGGFGPTELLIPDYWTLRARSAQLFETNLYARAIVRRLVTNEINVGLHLEATPEEAILGFSEDALSGWSELVENRFGLWARAPRLCDVNERLTFGMLQAQTRLESLVVGDVLVVLRQDQRTRLPRIQLINGSLVRTPLDWDAAQRGNKICLGVEIDPTGRHVAFWIQQPDGTSKRLPAIGEKSGRRLAWLVYGTDKRLDDVRGKPLLGIVLQALRDIDRYRDSALRKAVINSMLALFIKKNEDKPGTRPITGGAIRRGLDTAIDSRGAARTFHVSEQIPGLVLDELQTGEEPHAFPSQGTDEKFRDFEQAMVLGMAAGLNIPPEILRLTFNNNYSASQAAINEFKMYLNQVRTEFGDSFCQPVYVEWLLSETLLQKIEAQRLLESWRDASAYDVFESWTSADWSGAIKPAVDLSKLVAGYVAMINEGLITRDRAARELTGSKYSKNVQKLRRENLLLAEARRALGEFDASASAPTEPTDSAEPTDSTDSIDDEPIDQQAA